MSISRAKGLKKWPIFIFPIRDVIFVTNKQQKKCKNSNDNNNNTSYLFFLIFQFLLHAYSRNNNQKPTGYFMCQQVSRRNDNSRTHSSFMCSVRWLISTQTAIISLHYINLLVFTTETKCLLLGAALHASSTDLSKNNFTKLPTKINSQCDQNLFIKLPSKQKTHHQMLNFVSLFHTPNSLLPITTTLFTSERYSLFAACFTIRTSGQWLGIFRAVKFIPPPTVCLKRIEFFVEFIPSCTAHYKLTNTYRETQLLWHSEDRASWYILIMKPTRCTNFSNLFLE